MAFVNFREPELLNLMENQANSDEWVLLAENLGMNGQLKNLKIDINGVGNPNPYMPINRKWLKIFRTLCGAKIDYKEYTKSIIPLDALKEIELCVKNNYFEKIEIWWDDIAPDPLIVGVLNFESRFEKNFFLIGRFGDEVLPLEELEIKAINRLCLSFMNELQKAQKTIQESVITYLNDNMDVHINVSNGHSSLNS
jgi:hypothetical protein